MRFNYRVMLAAGCVSLTALCTPADSRPAPAGIDQSNVRLPLPRPKNIMPKPSPAAAERTAPVGHASLAARASKSIMRGWPALVVEARKYMGTNPTDRSRLWCATFMNFVLAKVGYAGTNSDAAKSFAYYGRRISEPQIGAIAVLTRGRRGGHVGVVSGIDANGNPIIISGNHNRRVGEAVYSRARVIAYVMPTERRLVATQVAERTPISRPASEPGLESPITELLAAIEAEQGRAEPRRQAGHPASVRAGSQGLDPALAEFLGMSERAQADSRVSRR